jgi:hypothetical protein
VIAATDDTSLCHGRCGWEHPRRCQLVLIGSGDLALGGNQQGEQALVFDTIFEFGVTLDLASYECKEKARHHKHKNR